MRDESDGRRSVASLTQTLRLFGHHRPDATPEEPEKQLADARSDEDLESELEDLERNNGCS